jgi:hypothetical protein
VCDQVKVKCDLEVTAVRRCIKFKTEQKSHTDIGTSDVKVEMEQEQADMNTAESQLLHTEIWSQHTQGQADTSLVGNNDILKVGQQSGQKMMTNRGVLISD